jgi:cytoskeletal protein CcmA (bactofilin family)
MDKNPYSNLDINGVATASGGQYEQVNIEGVGKVEGDVRAASFRLNGVATVRGSVETERLESNGKLKIEGLLSAGTSHMDGYTDVLGSLSGEHVTSKGLLQIRGDCELERFDAEGGFVIDGLLNAGFVNVQLYGRAKTREIGCESILVRKIAKSQWKEMLRKMFGKSAAGLEAGTIEGDDVDLEYTAASVVRGNRVTLGPGCRIGRVEYRTELKKHPAAQVGEERKTGDGSHFA